MNMKHVKFGKEISQTKVEKSWQVVKSKFSR